MSWVISSALIVAIKKVAFCCVPQTRALRNWYFASGLRMSLPGLGRSRWAKCQMLTANELLPDPLQLPFHGAVINRAADARNGSAQDFSILVIPGANALAGNSRQLRFQGSRLL